MLLAACLGSWLAWMAEEEWEWRGIRNEKRGDDSYVRGRIEPSVTIFYLLLYISLNCSFNSCSLM